MKFAAVIFTVAAAILMGMPASAARKKAPRHPPQSQHVACTRGGCHPIPPGCHPEIGYDPWGNPTGYDIVVCPRYR